MFNQTLLYVFEKPKCENLLSFIKYDFIQTKQPRESKPTPELNHIPTTKALELQDYY